MQKKYVIHVDWPWKGNYGGIWVSPAGLGIVANTIYVTLMLAMVGFK